jgi:hypothetical protein
MLLRWAAEMTASPGEAAIVAAADPQNRSLKNYLDGVAEPPINDATATSRWLEALLRHLMDEKTSALVDLGGRHQPPQAARHGSGPRRGAGRARRGFHGSNDGQKGTGLIMLILIGAAPTTYALNRAMPDSTTPMFLQATQEAQAVFRAHAGASPPPADAAAARAVVGEALKTKDATRPEVYAALAVLTGDIARQVSDFGAIMAVSAAATTNVRNDMYLASDAVRVMGARPPGFGDADLAALKSLRSSLDSGTKFIPIWVKVSVALALGLGTMVGWKRIVVTVGEKIGKTHLTYGRAPAPRSWRWRRSAWRTCTGCRYPRRMCCRAAALRARWRRTARDCSGARSRTWHWPGF